MPEKQFMPPVEWLRDRFYFDGKVLRFLKDNGRAKAGQSAQHRTSNGYLTVNATHDGKRKRLSVHRIVLSLKMGRPVRDDEEVDHIDRNRTNNHPDNLRLSTRRKNCLNKSKKAVGVIYVPYTNKTNPYAAQITIQGKNTGLGYFKTFEEARSAFLKAFQEAENA